ncbi:hypothetical protein K504DRAFT_446359 [Pleomassaria siparia CBS 279.74]|uniref:Uncharacterized protein n=1 Tax=Pleomassaria siparia CBS 279.74 TaxID=1314801 RepID=A0A6G1KT56_9PLEO|nr:hypothetical protein K504DRAFT_446359 [Pleomassaria siparia CBS 279.74]
MVPRAPMLALAPLKKFLMGATAMSRLSLFSTSAKPLPLTALLFLLTQINFFILLNSRYMQGEIKYSSLDFNAFYCKVNSITKEDNAFRRFCNAVRKRDVAKREIILRKLYSKLLDNLTTQGLTSLGKAETPPCSPTPKPADLLKTPITGKALVPLPYTLPPISADTLKTPTYYSKLPKSTNTLKTLPSRDLLPKSTNAELEAMRRLNAEIIKDVAAVASCILDPNYR